MGEADPEQVSRRRGAGVALVLLVALAGVGLSVFTSSRIRVAEERRLEAAVNRRAHDLQVMLAGRVREYNLAAWYLRKSMLWIGPEDRGKFAGTAQGLLARFPELQAVEWSPRVPAQRRKELERLAREAGLAGFSFTEPGEEGAMHSAGDREDYLPVYFVEPLEGNDRALGLDLYRALPASTVREARDLGRMRLSEPIRLVQETGESLGVVLYAPFYRGGELRKSPTLETRRESFGGVFQLVFRAEDLFGKLLDADIVRQAEFLPGPMPEEDVPQKVVSGARRDLHEGMDLLAVDEGTGKTLYFRSAPIREEAISVPSSDEFEKGGEMGMAVVHFAGRHWRLLVRPSPEFVASHLSVMPVSALGGGLAFTLLLMAYVMTGQRRSAEVAAMVDDRTADLKRTVAQLKARQERLQKVEVTLTELGRLRVVGDARLGRGFDAVCEKLARAFEIDRVGIWLFDETGRRLYCESEFRLATGEFGRGGTIGVENCPRYFAAVEGNRVISAVNARRDERTVELAERYLVPDKVFSLMDAPIRKGGRLVGVICHESVGRHRRWTQEEKTLAAAMGDFVGMLMSDADRLAAEKRLRDSERLYHSLVENLPQFVFRKDLEGRFTFVNEQMAEAYGRKVSDVLGRTDGELSTPELARRFQADDRRVIERGEVLEFVEENVLATGRVFLHTCKTPLRDANGRIVGVQGISWDVSERFRMQEALNASDERFRRLVDRLDCIVWEAESEEEGRAFTFVSRQVEALLGFPPTLLVEERGFLERHVEPKDWERVVSAMQSAVTAGHDTTIEYRMTAADGRVVWLRDIVSVNTDESGQVTGLHGVMVDITEARRLEGELRVNAERMKIFIERTPTAVAMFDREMRYLMASSRWYEENSLADKDIIGQGHYDIVPDIPDRWRRIHRHCLAGNTAACDEDPFPRENGSVDYVRWEIHPWHEASGEVGGIVMFSEIITERVRARLAIQRGEAILQATGRAAELLLKSDAWTMAAPEVLAVLGEATGSARLRLLRNVAEAEIEPTNLGYEWCRGREMSEVTQEIDWTRPELDEWKAGLKSGGAVQGHGDDFTKEERALLGATDYSCLFFAPVMVRGRWWGTLTFEEPEAKREWSGPEIGALKGAADNLAAAVERELAGGERLEIERRMQDAQKLESLGVLAGGIAHDFNNLLTSIVGNAGLMRLDIRDGSPLESPIGIIENTAMRASDLCRQLLAYAGKGRFEMKLVDLNEVVRDTAELLRVSISKKAALEQSLAGGLSPVYADSAQLRQIVMNLVINASEAIGDRSGTISLRTRVRTLLGGELSGAWRGEELEPGEYVCLEVHDDGCGMSEKTMRRVFEPFFTTKFTGRGLGMAAVLGIVKSHSGALKVESAEGRGSSFELLLPCSRQAGGVAETAEAGAPVAEIPEGRRILIVEDDEALRDVLGLMLRKWGLRSEAAKDGRVGVEVFEREPSAFDLVLMDLTMPGLNGLEAAAKMRALRPGVKILLVSGYDESGAVGGDSPAAVDGFVQKPYRWSQLKTTLAELLGG